MKKILSILMLTLAVLGTAKAASVQRIILKNGSVLNGFIERQDINSNIIVFHSDNAVISLDGKLVINVFEKKHDISKLQASWKEWAKKNDAYTVQGTDSFLLLHNIEFRQPIYGMTSVDGVRLLENGTRVKYMELTPSVYDIKWKDVVAIKSDKRPKLALTGIDRVYELNNGDVIEGQYAEETDSTLSLYLSNGMLETFSLNDVVRYTVKPLNPKQSIILHSPLLDIVKMKGGETVKGIIIEQNYGGNTESEYFLVIEEENGNQRKIYLNRVTGVEKEKNPQYQEKIDVVLEPGQILLNGKEMLAVNATEGDSSIELESFDGDSIPKFTKEDDKSLEMVLQFKNSSIDGESAFKLVELKDNTSISYKSLLNAIEPKSEETSVNGNTIVVFVIEQTGTYALYDTKRHISIPFNVE